MASGRPVIAWRKGGAVETIQEGKTGVFFEKQTIEEIRKAVLNFQDKDFDPEYIRDYARKYSVRRFKREIKEFIDKEMANFKKAI